MCCGTERYGERERKGRTQVTFITLWSRQAGRQAYIETGKAFLNELPPFLSRYENILLFKDRVNRMH